MSKKQIATTAAPGAIGPYSQAIAAGNWVYTSGQLGLNPETGSLLRVYRSRPASRLIM